MDNIQNLKSEKYKLMLVKHINDSFIILDKSNRSVIFDIAPVAESILSEIFETIVSDVTEEAKVEVQKSSETKYEELSAALSQLTNQVHTILAQKSAIEEQDVLTLQKQQVRMIQLMQSDILEIQNRLKKLEG